MGFSEGERKISKETESFDSEENARKSEKITNEKDEKASKRFAIPNTSESNISSQNSNSNDDQGLPATDYNSFTASDPKISDTLLVPEDIQNSMSETSDEKNHLNIVQPHPQLPKPEPPRGLSASPPTGDVSLDQSVQRSKSLPENFSVEDMRRFIRERGNAIAKRFSSIQESRGGDSRADFSEPEVTEFKISGLKIMVKLKSEDEIRGRITFFSRSNCRDCAAVRSFFRQRGLNFVEINVDVFPTREKELRERTGGSQVPMIFFNEKLFGGLVALNSLRNSGEFDRRLKEMLVAKCSGEAPAPPVYGFDDDEERPMDEMVEFVRVLRQRLPIQDRLMKMKIVKNCFSGGEMVEVLVDHLDCGRKKAIEIGRKLAKKHFIHHVFGENDFEDGDHYYRLLEHQSFIPKCYNFRVSANDSEPQPASLVVQKLHKIMSAILESYASDDRCHVDYLSISRSEEFRRYLNLAQDLQRVNLLELSSDEKLAFFLNLYNAMVIHAMIRVGCPGGLIERKSFFSDFQYVVGGYSYSLNTIKNGILRRNRRPAYTLIKPFGTCDKRLQLAVPKVNPLVHFGLCDGTRSSPTVRFFTRQGVEAELRRATREFFQNGGIEVVLDKRRVHIARIIKWYSGDFGQGKEMLKWVINYLDASKAGLLMHLLGDGGPISVVYQDYDWSINS